jgi:hypothetical protein
MSFLGLVGILLGLVALPFVSRQMSRTRFAIFMAAYLAHIGAAVVYYFYVLTAGGDSDIYYYDELRIYRQEFAFGTVFIVWVVQSLKEFLGGTYLDYFLVFQAVGFWGIALLMRTFDEMYEGSGARSSSLLYVVLFLPGLHFWTAAIGKDAILFFGVCLTTWAAIRIQRRQLAFAAGALLVLLVRPHIAAIAFASLGVALLFARESPRIVRFLLIGGLAFGLFMMIGTVRSTYNVDVSDADSMSDFFQRMENVAQSSSGGNTVVIGSFPYRLFSLLLRPFFIDAEGPMGMITSLENVAFLFIYLWLLWHWRAVVALFRKVAFVRYATTFALFVMILLAVVYYNVGLGLRQRTMFLPGLLCLFVAVRLTTQIGRQRSAEAPAVPDYAE